MDETYEILLGLRERYEAHHKLRYTDDSLHAAAKYSAQYISDRFLPDKVSTRRSRYSSTRRLVVVCVAGVPPLFPGNRLGLIMARVCRGISMRLPLQVILSCLPGQV